MHDLHLHRNRLRYHAQAPPLQHALPHAILLLLREPASHKTNSCQTERKQLSLYLPDNPTGSGRPTLRLTYPAQTAAVTQKSADPLASVITNAQPESGGGAIIRRWSASSDENSRISGASGLPILSHCYPLCLIPTVPAEGQIQENSEAERAAFLVCHTSAAA